MTKHDSSQYRDLVMKGHLVHGNYCSMVLADLHKAFTSIWVVVISMLGVTHDLWELNVTHWDFHVQYGKVFP